MTRLELGVVWTWWKGVRSWMCLESREPELLTKCAWSEREGGIPDDLKVWQDGVAIPYDKEDSRGAGLGVVGTEYEESGFAELILRSYQWRCQVGSWICASGSGGRSGLEVQGGWHSHLQMALKT